MSGWLLDIVARIVGAILPVLSEEFREFLEKTVKELEKKADATPSSFDNMLVDMLKTILDLNG